MNIYIYGDKLFKKEISKVLEKQTITDKLDEIAQSSDELMGQIITINTLKELKKSIENEPQSIFLIDNKKIIYDNIFTKTMKFLNPKDGIKKSFLEKYEIAITVELNDVATITQYILNRLDTYKAEEITQIDQIREKDIVSALSNI
jgi:hypothetical protein